jgi:hypothetical protein
MKGFIVKAVSAGCLTGVLLLGVGCAGYQAVVDPCYPERYNSQAQKEVCEPLATQIHNGHILDQTVWNWYFEPGTAKLNPAGQEHLTYIVRRRPAPDPCVYVATAEPDDIRYDPDHADLFPQDRATLDAQRVDAVQKYLNAQTSGRGYIFQVTVHDPAEPYEPANGVANVIRGWYGGFGGGAAGGGGGGGGGGAPPAGR